MLYWVGGEVVGGYVFIEDLLFFFLLCLMSLLLLLFCLEHGKASYRNIKILTQHQHTVNSSIRIILYRELSNPKREEVFRCSDQVILRVHQLKAQAPLSLFKQLGSYAQR